MSKIKILLTQTIDKLGKIGDLLIVKKGYARNFLLPNNIAIIETKQNKNIIKKILNQKEKIEKENIKKAEDILIQLTQLNIVFKLKKSIKINKIFGSISALDIQKYLVKNNIYIKRKHIKLEHPINKEGIYQCKIKIYKNIEKIINFKVII